MMNYPDAALAIQNNFLATPAANPPPEHLPLGESINNIGIATNRLEVAHSNLEERLIGLRPTLARDMGAVATPAQRPLAMDASSHAGRLHRIADMLEKLFQQL